MNHKDKIVMIMWWLCDPLNLVLIFWLTSFQNSRRRKSWWHQISVGKMIVYLSLLYTIHVARMPPRKWRELLSLRFNLKAAAEQRLLRLSYSPLGLSIFLQVPSPDEPRPNEAVPPQQPVHLVGRPRGRLVRILRHPLRTARRGLRHLQGE